MLLQTPDPPSHTLNFCPAQGTCAISTGKFPCLNMGLTRFGKLHLMLPLHLQASLER